MAWRRHALIGALAFAGALTLLLVMRSESALHPPYPRGQVVRAAMRDPRVASTLEQNSWTDARVIALDDTHWRATFTDGPRALLDAAVGPDGRVDALERRLPGSHLPGSAVLWSPSVLILFALLFVIAVAVRPLRSLRNVDAAVMAAGFTLSALLLDARLVAAHVYVGVACLAYLAVRCAQAGFGAPARPAPAEPLYRRVFRGADVPRLLRVVTAATLLGGVLLTLTSTGIADVAFAGLAGATKLNHGELPYGRLTSEVVHGDTYPLLTYVLYMPFAAISPVRDAFDNMDGALWLNAIALVAGAGVLYRLAGRREPGVANALAWLAFPPVLLAASSGTNDVPAAVFAAAALALFARPALSAGALALAGLTKVVPALALAVWLPRLRGRTLVVACAAVAIPVALTLVALVIIGDGSGGLRDSWNSIRFQLERGSWYSLWQQTGTRFLQPVFQAATLAFAAVAAFEVWRQGPAAIGIRRVAALTGAVVALFQIAANYWTYAYLPWLLPFILVALLPPVAAVAPPARRRSRPPARRAP